MMLINKANKSTVRKLGYGSLLLTVLVVSAITIAISADDRKVETIDATAMGTSTQLGKTVGVKVTITSTLQTRTDKSSLRLSRRARIKAW